MTKVYRAGGVTLPDGPFMIGAGVCKNPGATMEWLKAFPVVSGSYTPIMSSGNAGKVFFPELLEELVSIGAGNNSFGMPNMGNNPAAIALAELKSRQPLIVSIAGFKPEDYVNGVETFTLLQNLAAIELNMGCPNKQGEHTGDIMSFDPPAVRQTLEGLSNNGVSMPLWLKFSPYSNPNELRRMAELLNEFRHKLNLAVVTCNTFPNSYMPQANLTPNKGRAGLSGPALKYIALGQVHQFREYLDPLIDVIGVGGGMSGDDIVDLLDAGAAAAQVTTWPFWAGSPKVFYDQLLSFETGSRLMEYLTGNNN